MKVFLAGGESRHWIHDELADIEQKWKPYILESFLQANSDTERLLPKFGDFLLDSGAFTFMSSSKTHLDWEEYLERYADFISRNKIKQYFELDIDSVVGYEKVKEYRRTLERKTGVPVIPVWHSQRGVDEFLRCCDEYDYVALGGIVGKEWDVKAENAIPWFIREAHKRNAKIHGLGYTKLTKLSKFHFDSVDSTAWLSGNRFGHIYRFNGRTIQRSDVPTGKKMKDTHKIALHNYQEWLKFQKYADTHL